MISAHVNWKGYLNPSPSLVIDLAQAHSKAHIQIKAQVHQRPNYSKYDKKNTRGPKSTRAQ